MIVQLFSDIGPWAWFILGFVLLVGEVFLPGVFLMWFGLSALTIGTATILQFSETEWWTWQSQLIAFGVVSFVFVLIGNRLFPANRNDDHAASLNRPLAKMVGREAVLLGPLENGAGRIRLGDTTWRVTGQDLPDGTRVRVLKENDGLLVVEPI